MTYLHNGIELYDGYEIDGPDGETLTITSLGQDEPLIEFVKDDDTEGSCHPDDLGVEYGDESDLNILLDRNGDHESFFFGDAPEGYEFVESRDGYMPSRFVNWCEDLSEHLPHDETEYWEGEYYSRAWYEENIRCCEGCDESFHVDRMNGNGYCGDCCCEDCCNRGSDDGDSDHRIKDYGNKSANNLIPESRIPIMFGIELEVEAARDSRVEYSLNAFDAVLPKEYCVYKDDGSLSNGYEIVTRPDNPEVHKRILKAALSDKKVRETTTSWKSGNCGIHVHVSRKPLSRLWIGRMMVFINSYSMKDVINKVAGRYSGQYCTIKRDARLTDKDGYHSEALNLGNRETIEFRIFRGTLDPDAFIKNIEFVQATLAFCKPGAGCSNSHMTEARDRFLAFIRRERKTYPHLYSFLVRKELVTSVTKPDKRVATPTSVPGIAAWRPTLVAA